MGRREVERRGGGRQVVVINFMNCDEVHMCMASFKNRSLRKQWQ